MIWVVIFIALVLRLIALNQSFWLDEAINVNNAAALDIPSLVFNYSLGDFHPPLYHAVLHYWINIFGSSEVSVRIPSVGFGVATVFVTYLIGKELFERKTATIAAILLATGPLSIYYSQEARMYMLATLLASCSVYFFIALIRRENIWLWLGFVVSTTLMLYADYLPYLLMPIFIIYLIIFRKKIATSTIKTFIPSFVLIFILLIPWFVVFPKQINVGLSAASVSPAWAQVVGSPQIKNLLLTFVKFTIGRISNDNDSIYALFFAPAGLFMTILFLLSLFRLSARRAFLWFWLLGSIFLGYLLAYIVPIFTYFRFVFALPAFYLIIASGINTINWVPSTRTLLTVALAINLISASIYFTNPKFQREDWRSATAYIHAKASPSSIVLFESDFPAAPFDYYNHGKIASFGSLSGFNADPQFVKDNLKKLTNGKDKVFLFGYLSQITDPKGLVSQELFNLGFINLQIKDFHGVGFVYEFIKR